MIPTQSSLGPAVGRFRRHLLALIKDLQERETTLPPEDRILLEQYRLLLDKEEEAQLRLGRLVQAVHRNLPEPPESTEDNQ